MAKSSALMSYNVFTFPNEAQMQLHIKIWEVHGPPHRSARHISGLHADF